MKLIVLKGLPGSGKSYLAKQLQEQYQAVILSTDDVITAKDVYLWSPSYIGLSHQLNQEKCREACRRNMNVIIDNTNTTTKEIKPYYDIAKEFNYEFELVEPKTAWKDDIDECFKRNSHSVPLESLRKMKQRYQSNAKVMEQLEKNVVETITNEKVKHIEGLQHCIICDLDGTLAIVGDRPFYDASRCDLTDTLNTAVADILRVYANENNFATLVKPSYKIPIILMSGREDKDRAPTERFLKNNMIEYDYLYMRTTGDSRKDSIIKKELFDANIRDKYNVLFVLDDRDQVVKLWRDMGLWCLQVNYGDF